MSIITTCSGVRAGVFSVTWRSRLRARLAAKLAQSLKRLRNQPRLEPPSARNLNSTLESALSNARHRLQTPARRDLRRESAAARSRGPGPRHTGGTVATASALGPQ